MYFVKIKIMNAIAILEKSQKAKIGKEPVVLVSLKAWQDIESALEDYSMSRSQSYRKAIAGSRKQIKSGKLYELNLESGRFKKGQVK